MDAFVPFAVLAHMHQRSAMWAPQLVVEFVDGNLNGLPATEAGRVDDEILKFIVACSRFSGLEPLKAEFFARPSAPSSPPARNAAAIRRRSCVMLRCVFHTDDPAQVLPGDSVRHLRDTPNGQRLGKPRRIACSDLLLTERLTGACEDSIRGK